MDLLDSLRALARRWPVTLALLVMTICGSVAALVIIPWQYESTATVVFLSSREGSKPVGGNPWLAFDGSLTITAEVVARGMSDERTAQELKAKGDTAEFTVGLAQDSRGPLMDIVATAPDPAVAQSTMESLVALCQQRLTELQKKSAIQPSATIRSSLVTATDEAELAAQKKIRTIMVIVAGGMLLTVGVPLFIESLVQKRRRQVEALTRPTVQPAEQIRSARSAGAPATTAFARGAAPLGGGRGDHGREPQRPTRGGPGGMASPPPVTSPQPAIAPDDDLFRWTDDPPRQGPGRRAAGPPAGSGPTIPSAGGRNGSVHHAPGRNGSGDEPYISFDPTGR
jgi:hypothetical protein